MREQKINLWIDSSTQGSYCCKDHQGVVAWIQQRPDKDGIITATFRLSESLLHFLFRNRNSPFSFLLCSFFFKKIECWNIQNFRRFPVVSRNGLKLSHATHILDSGASKAITHCCRMVTVAHIRSSSMSRCWRAVLSKPWWYKYTTVAAHCRMKKSEQTREFWNNAVLDKKALEDMIP